MALTDDATFKADQADKHAFRAQRRDVAGDIVGAADLDGVVIDLEHRRRRFRRDARDLTINEIVEHHVADAQHGLLPDQRSASAKSNIVCQCIRTVRGNIDTLDQVEKARMRRRC